MLNNVAFFHVLQFPELPTFLWVLMVAQVYVFRKLFSSIPQGISSTGGRCKRRLATCSLIFVFTRIAKKHIQLTSYIHPRILQNGANVHSAILFYNHLMSYENTPLNGQLWINCIVFMEILEWNGILLVKNQGHEILTV